MDAYTSIRPLDVSTGTQEQGISASRLSGNQLVQGTLMDEPGLVTVGHSILLSPINSIGPAMLT